MRLNRKSAAKLASLSALGAGALSLTAGKAEAGIIYSALDLHVGFACGCTPPFYQSFASATLADPARSLFINFFTRTTSRFVGSLSQYQGFLAVVGQGVAAINTPGGISTTASGATFPLPGFAYVPLQFKVAPGTFTDTLAPTRFMRLFAAGARFDTAAGSIAPGANAVAHRRVLYNYTSNGPTSYVFGGSDMLYPNPVNPANRYALFSFSDPACSGGNCYGWIEMSLEMLPDGPNLHLSGWAYDDTGAFLPAGEVPEPSTLALTGLAALALGAKGIRRWRASRPS